MANSRTLVRNSHNGKNIGWINSGTYPCLGEIHSSNKNGSGGTPDFPKSCFVVWAYLLHYGCRIVSVSYLI